MNIVDIGKRLERKGEDMTSEPIALLQVSRVWAPEGVHEKYVGEEDRDMSPEEWSMAIENGDACSYWDTVSVEPDRKAAEDVAERREYYYGKKDKDWRVYVASLYDSSKMKYILRAACFKIDYEDILKKKSVLINLSGHSINDKDSGYTAGPAKHDKLLRVQQFKKRVGECMDSSMMINSYEVVGDIPEVKEDTLYIVSRKVAEAAVTQFPERYDFVYPDEIVHNIEVVPVLNQNGTPVLYDDGTPVTKKLTKVVGCRGFAFPAREIG